MSDRVRSLAKRLIHETIRSLLSPRIVRCINDRVKNLKQNLRSYLIVPGGAAIALAALSETRQATIDEVQDEVEISCEPVTKPGGDEEATEQEAIGVIYVRVSTDEQADEGESLDGQEDDLEDIAEEQNIKLPYDPIRDEGETGTNFDREGIKRVFRLAEEGKISHLLVDDVSRIGRSAPETLYFIYILSDRFGIEIVTVNGPLKFGEVDGLLQTTLKTLMSHISVHERARKSLRSKIRGFVQEQNWSSSGMNIPFGYQPDGNGWIEIDEDEAEIVEDIFDIYVSTNNYRKTQDQINDRYARRLESNLSYYRVRKILRDTVYIGNASITVKADSVDAENPSVDDPDLAILDDKTFQRVQRCINQQNKKQSSGDDTIDLEHLTEIFGLVGLLETCPLVAIHCPECDAKMVKNGQRKLRNAEKPVHDYICPECERQKRFPATHELEKLRFHDRN